jgi:hypothetical protein
LRRDGTNAFADAAGLRLELALVVTTDVSFGSQLFQLSGVLVDLLRLRPGNRCHHLLRARNKRSQRQYHCHSNHTSDVDATEQQDNERPTSRFALSLKESVENRAKNSQRPVWLVENVEYGRCRHEQREPDTKNEFFGSCATAARRLPFARLQQLLHCWPVFGQACHCLLGGNPQMPGERLRGALARRLKSR